MPICITVFQYESPPLPGSTSCNFHQSPCSYELFQTCIAIFFFFSQVHYMNFIEKKTFALSPFYNKYQQFHFCMNLYSSVSCCECKRCGCICRQVCICLNIANVFAIWQCKCICRELGQMQLQHLLCPHVWMEMDIVHWTNRKIGKSQTKKQTQCDPLEETRSLIHERSRRQD